MATSRLRAPLAAIALVAGCSGEPVGPMAQVPAGAPSIVAPSPPVAYVIPDPDALSPGTALAIDGGSFGAVLDGVRVVARADGTLVAGDDAATRLARVQRVPPWLGGGFLFRSNDALYASSAFDGPLRPIAAFPSAIARVSFGPKSALVRAHDQQQWVLDPTTGATLPVFLLGVVDVAALADGRAAALTDTGQLFVSTDRGDHWSDASGLLSAAAALLYVAPRSPPSPAASDAEPRAWSELWVRDAAARSYRIEPGGAAREHRSPPSAAPSAIRPRDPAWRGREPPIVAAVRRGASVDARTAIVAADGDVVRVDLQSGAVKIVHQGRLPPDLPCEAVRAPDDVLFVCAASGRSAIVAGALGDGGPRVERSFAADGPFFAGDDGVLIFGGTCDGGKAERTACVREARGAWYEVGIEADADAGSDAGIEARKDAGASGDARADAGAGADPRKKAGVVAARKPGAPSARAAAEGSALRWIPRAGRRPIAVLAGAPPSLFDPAIGATRALHAESADGLTRVLASLSQREQGRIVDRRWSAGDDGTLRGWLEHGQTAAISAEGEITRSIFHYDRAQTAGPAAFASDREGRAFQSLDRGVTWGEVASPLRVKRTFEIRACSAVGCDLGTWARIGWDATRPDPRPAPAELPPVPTLARAPLREIVCSPSGGERLAALSRNPVFGDDAFGFGARHVDISRSEPNGLAITYDRAFFTRGPQNGAVSRSADDPRALRALVHGYHADFVPPEVPRSPLDGITVLGPRRTPDAYRRDVDFLEAFEPAGALRTTSLDARALVPFATAAQVTLAQMFAPEGPTVEAVVPIVPLDPAAPGGVVISLAMDGAHLLGVARAAGGGGAARGNAGAAAANAAPSKIALKLAGSYAGEGTPVSAIETARGIAVLVEGSDGSLVLDVSAAGVGRLHRLPAPPDNMFPPNADALAVGPRGALAIVRLASGATPPSAADPAVLIPLGGGPRVALAAWSTLLPADDPACRNDAAGYRAAITTMAPWLAVRGARFNASPAGAMSARVRWSRSRVCLEAIEIPEGLTTVRGGDEVETEIVARFVPPLAAGRVGVAPGVELRQPLTCALAPP